MTTPKKDPSSHPSPWSPTTRPQIVRPPMLHPKTRLQLRRSLGVLSIALLCGGVTTSLALFRSCPVQPATSVNAILDLPNSITSKSPSSEDDPAELSILLYNLQFRPRLLFASGQMTRAQTLGPFLQGYDAVVLSEGFDDYSAEILIQSLKSVYPHVSEPLGQNQGFSQDSGLIIASRWPITTDRQRQTVFGGDCHGQSCFNTQGALSVGITKAGIQYHLVTAQFQSGVNPRATEIRGDQLQQTQVFLADLPPNDPVIFAASLPISPERSPQSYEQLVQALDGIPVEAMAPTAYSVDSSQNPLVPSDRQDTPDVFLSLHPHPHPTIATTQIRPLRTDAKNSWTFSPWFYWQCPHQDLSDHYAVEATFRYDRSQ